MPAPIGNTNATRVWNDERDEALKDLLAHKATFREAASDLNAIFGTSYTRSAIGGRAMRLGLKSANPPKARPGVSRISPQCLAAAQASHKPGAERVKPMPQPIPQFHRDNLSGLRCAEVEPMNIALLDLIEGCCRWPVTDGSPHLFCGHLQVEGSSYCWPHYQLSLGTGTTSERRAAYG
jgi:GcrA cell cycle regulator